METVKRNWLQEAEDITDGKKIKPKKEHVVATVLQLREMKKRMEKINIFLKGVMGEVIAKRAARGQPLAVPPEVLLGNDESTGNA